MTRALKRTALAILGLIVLQLAVLGTAAAQQMDPPALPHQFYGTVTINGVAAPDGTRVSAEVDGAAGDGVVFKVNGVVAEETGVFKSSGSTELNLSATQTAGDPLIDRYDANGNGKIEKKEVIEAIKDYLFGEGDEAISKGDVIRLIKLYLFG